MDYYLAVKVSFVIDCQTKETLTMAVILSRFLYV